MSIDIQKTLGCDNLSQAYRYAYNKMQPILVDNDAIKQMSVMDLSALALYLGKFEGSRDGYSNIARYLKVSSWVMHTYQP